MPKKNPLDYTQYVEDTFDIAEYLTKKTAKRSSKLVTRITNSVKNPKDLQGLKTAIKDAKADYKGVFKDMSTHVRRKLATAMYNGAETVSAERKIRRSLERLPILEGLTRNIEFYTEGYFRRIVEPKIKSFMVTQKGSPTFKADLKALLKRSLIESEQYWKSVADTAAGRSYHYGVLKGAQMQGHSKYTLIAIIDERTTEFCKSIDGTVYYIQKALDDLADMASLRGKDVTDGPWNLVSEGKASATELMRKGYTSPPFHAHCRTRIQIS